MQMVGGNGGNQFRQYAGQNAGNLTGYNDVIGNQTDQLSSKNRPPMLNKDNYVPWSSRIIRYARSKQNGKMIVDSIENGPYVREMISTPENDIKWMDADDQAIQTILLGIPEDVYAAEKKAKLFNEWEKFTSNDGELIESYYHRFMQLMNDLKRNKHFPKKIAANLKILNNLQPEWKRHVTIVRQTKNLHEANFTQIYDFLKINQDENVEGNGGNQFGQYAGQVVQNQQWYNAWQNDVIQVAQNTVQNAGVQNGSNQNGLVVVPWIANQNGTGNIVAASAKEEFYFMAAAGDLDEIEEVNANCVLMANLQHASTSGTQLDKALVYDTDGSAEETVYCNLIDQVAQVNMVNCNRRATNVELKNELARYKIQEQRIEISQEKYEKIEKCYQKSVYQEQCLTRKINALHLSSAKQIMTLNDEISNINKQLSKEKSTSSSLKEEKKKLKHDFKTQEDRFLDKEVDLEAKIKDFENILLKRD
nr:hypothetical protein [Tanacetum cinerariifolium]